MSEQIHIRAGKSKRLIEMLNRVDKRRSYTFYLSSCYFSEQAAKKIIKEIQQTIRLVQVIIYIDRKTAIEKGSKSLKAFCESFKDIEVSILAVETSGLFHSKSYALISFDEDDEIINGSIILGSANLTGAGLTSRSGNIECLIDSQDIDLLIEHMEQLGKLKTISIEEINIFSRKEEFSFKYALLQSGRFLHKWNENLGQYLSIRYRISESGKSRIGDPSLKETGFNVETATISKRYLQFDYTPEDSEETDNIIRNFGIETYLGNWVPCSIVDSAFNNEELDNFKSQLISKIESQRLEIEKEIQKDFDYLKQQGLIEELDYNPVEFFNKKVKSLMENEFKLNRIYSKYEKFELPYDIHQKDHIIDLFDEMIEVAESKTRKNKSVKAFLQAYADFSLTKFEEALEE